FFFQAEDGIRDRNVTGVQTCALPISTPTFWHDRGPVHTEMGTTRSRSGNELRRERSDRAYGRHRPGAHSDGGSSGESPSWSARKRSKCSPISSAVGRSIVVASGEESSPSPRESYCSSSALTICRT